jgi:hypothetical protein
MPDVNLQLRRNMMVYLTLATIGMVILSTSLTGLVFQPGLPIPGADSSPSTHASTGATEPQTLGVGKALQFPFAISFGVILLVILLSLGKKVDFRQIAKWVACLLVVAFVSVLLNQIKFNLPVTPAGNSQEADLPPSVVYDIAPIGDPPQHLYSLVLIFILLAAAVLVAVIIAHAVQRVKADDAIGAEASEALRAIKEGADLRNVIYRCYLQMVKIASEKRGLTREESATPREFERYLVSKGIPDLPIHQLTGLFEKVRYGGKALDSEDEETAVACLSAIHAACESGEQKNR